MLLLLYIFRVLINIRTESRMYIERMCSPAQFLSLSSKSLEGRLGFGEVFVPVVLHIQIHLATTRTLPQLQRNLPGTQSQFTWRKQPAITLHVYKN